MKYFIKLQRSFVINLIPWINLESLGSRLEEVELREVDIELDENEKWFNKYRYEIPVFYLNKAIVDDINS